jgi:hypothetical protein
MLPAKSQTSVWEFKNRTPAVGVYTCYSCDVTSPKKKTVVTKLNHTVDIVNEQSELELYLEFSMHVSMVMQGVTAKKTCLQFIWRVVW